MALFGVLLTFGFAGSASHRAAWEARLLGDPLGALRIYRWLIHYGTAVHDGLKTTR